jgi:dihydroorotase
MDRRSIAVKFDLLLKNVQIVDEGAPDGALLSVDIVVHSGRIADISPAGAKPHAQAINAEGAPASIIDGQGRLCSPGFVDLHAHLREPGQTHKETLRTGTQAAARGGYTYVACMPNTRPVLDDPQVLQRLYEQAAAEAVVQVGIVAAISKGSAGEELTDFVALRAAGAVAFSDDGRGVQRASVMRAALQKAAEVGLPIMAHCEDEWLSGGGVLNEGPAATSRCLGGIPAEAEAAHVARDIVLAEKAAARYHVCHLSCAQSLRLVKEAKARGQAVTCEVTPHHLLLHDADIAGEDTNYKMNPPLRSAADRQALLLGLCDGTIDAIATDHAPHTPEEKAIGLSRAPFGVIGLETAFPLLYTHLVESGRLPLWRLCELLSRCPAALLGLPDSAGRLQVGGRADLALIDLRTTRTVATELRSKSRNTPFLFQRLRGWPVLTLCGGRTVWSNLDSSEEPS